MTRIYQGLGFYYPTNYQEGYPFLQNCLEKHPLNTFVQEFKKSYGLDILKAFYIAKEAYLNLTKQSGNACGFDVPIDQNKLKSISGSMASQAKSFLESDKKDLLMCYSLFLSGKMRPSQGKLCLQKE